MNFCSEAELSSSLPNNIFIKMKVSCRFISKLFWMKLQNFSTLRKFYAINLTQNSHCGAYNNNNSLIIASLYKMMIHTLTQGLKEFLQTLESDKILK